MELVGDVIVSDTSWLRIETLTGAGSANITLICIHENRGRMARTLTITGTTSKGVSDSCVVTNLGADEFISMDVEYHKIGDGETAMSLTGESNAELLTVTLGSNATGVTISSIEISTDDGLTWETITNASAIAGNPGLYDGYKFRINLAISQFSLTSGNYLAVDVRGTSDALIGETLLRLTSTTVYDTEETYSLSGSDPLTIIGNSDSSSLSLSGALSNLPCMIYLSFDQGSTWELYTEGTPITNPIIERGGNYMFKVVVDTQSLSAETADMALNIVDNTGTTRATSTISFAE